jgi:hypothetical protein
MYDVFLIKKRDERRHAHHLLIIEALRRTVGVSPTRDELQAFAKIRRKRFIQVLSYLIKTGDVERFGQGRKGEPFRYKLGQKHQYR